MISDYMREIAKQDSFTRHDVMHLVEDIDEKIKQSYLLQLNENGEQGCYDGDAQEVRMTAAINLRKSLQDFQDLLFPREAEERKARDARRAEDLRNMAR